MRFLWCILVAGCSSTTPTPQTLHDQGIITLDSQKYQSGGTTYGQGSVSAVFVHESVDPYFGCSKKTFGSCSVRFDCKPVLTQPPDDLGLQPYASAGKITVGGLMVMGMAMPVELTVMDMGMFAGQYNTFQTFMPMFAGGEALTVSAAGGEVPAFSGQVTAPAQPTVTAPAMPNGTATISRSKDLSFTWTGGSGQLHFVMTVQPAMGAPSGLDCSWGVGDGSGTIPAAALQMMPAGSGQGTLSVASTSSLMAGSWTVQIASTTAPIHADGTPFQFASFVLQ
jgi:hypothetical protein